MRFGKPEELPRAQRTRGKVPEQPHTTSPVRPLQPSGLTEESRVLFDPVAGHAHDGSGSHTIALGGDVTGTNTAATVAKIQGVPITAPVSGDDGQFPRYNSGAGTITWEPVSVAGHTLLSATHTDTTAASVARGDVITGQGASPKFQRLALGASGRVLRSDGTDVAWTQLAFSDLSGTLTNTQHGALSAASSHVVGGDLSGTTAAATVASLQGKAVDPPASGYARYNGTKIIWDTPSPGVTSHALLSATHTDTTAAAPTRGDLVTAQGASPTWTRLALGLSGRYLRSDGTDAAWAQIPHSDLTYAGLTSGHVLKATGATAASFGQLAHSQLGSVGANDHHNQAHAFFGSDHSDVSGSPSAGAMLYRNGSSQWAPLAIGSTDQILKVNGSGVPSWAAPTSVATARAPVYGWRRSNISTGAGFGFGEMPGFDAVNTGERMAYSGTIVGIAVVLDGDVGASGDSYQVMCYKATSDLLGAYVATAVTCTITGGGSTERSAAGSGFSVSFNAGDILTVFDKKTGSVAGRSAKCHLLVVFD